MRRPATFDGLPPLREVIEKHGLMAKKNLGQNFILDLNLTSKIANLAGPVEGRIVVEVGPGPGGLTRSLLHNGARHVVAVERDARCLAALREVAAHWPGRLTIIEDDALAVSWPELLSDAGLAADEKARIVANLPYGIATKLLIGWLEAEPWPPWFDSMALMFQREVAERITAEAGTKPFGRLAVIAQWRTVAEIVMTLGPEAFAPSPKVASAVVALWPREKPTPACDVRYLGRVTQVLFNQRRKMLRAALKPLYREPEILLARLGIAPTLRAEALSVEDIVRLSAALADVPPNQNSSGAPSGG